MIAALAALIFCAAPSPARPAAGSPPSAESIRAVAVRNFSADAENLWRYSHLETEVLTKNGRTTRRKLWVYYVNGHQVSITLAVNGHAVSGEQLAQERHDAQMRAADLRLRPPPPAGSLVFNGRAYPFAKLAGDYLYAPARVEQWRGRTTWIYPVTPNPNAPARSREEQVLLSSEGEVWVDAQDLHVVRISLHTFEPVKYFLGILATVHSAHLDLQLQRIAPGEWMPDRTDFAFDATILVFKRLRQSKLQTFTDFQPLPASGTPSLP